MFVRHQKSSIEHFLIRAVPKFKFDYAMWCVCLFGRHQIQASTNEKVLATKKDLQRLTVVVRHGDKQQKLQVERLTSDFQKVVEMYSACQQVS